MPLMLNIFLLVIIVAVVAHGVYMHMHTSRLRSVTESINKKQLEQRVLLNSFMDKLRKMDIYRDAVVNVEKSDVKKLFKDLISDEENHLKVLKKALLK